MKRIAIDLAKSVYHPDYYIVEYLLRCKKEAGAHQMLIVSLYIAFAAYVFPSIGQNFFALKIEVLTLPFPLNPTKRLSCGCED